MVVKLLTAAVLAFTNRVHALRRQGASGLDASEGQYWAAEKQTSLPFPKELNNKFKDAYRLGSGNFGEAWRVNSEDGLRVLKFFRLSGGDRITWSNYIDPNLGDIDRKREMNKVIESAKAECQAAVDIQALGAVEDPRGASRIMKCFGGNFPPEQTFEGDPDEPLYLELEYCGNKTLVDYIESDAGNPDLMMELFRQVLEGLQYLASLSPPWSHQDLKPDNIVVQKVDNAFTVHLIDLGLAAKTPQEGDASSEVCMNGQLEYVPYIDALETMKAMRNHNTRDLIKWCSPKWDVFAAGVTFLDIASQSQHFFYDTIWGVSPVAWQLTKGVAWPPNRTFLNEISSNGTSFAKNQVRRHLHESGLKESVPVTSALDIIKSCLSFDPDDRPDASRLLAKLAE